MLRYYILLSYMLAVTLQASWI